MMYQATVTNLCPRVQVSIDPLPAAAWQILNIFDHRTQLRESCNYLTNQFYYYNDQISKISFIIIMKRLELPLIEKNLKSMNAE